MFLLGRLQVVVSGGGGAGEEVSSEGTRRVSCRATVHEEGEGLERGDVSGTRGGWGPTGFVPEVLLL